MKIPNRYFPISYSPISLHDITLIDIDTVSGVKQSNNTIDFYVVSLEENHVITAFCKNIKEAKKLFMFVLKLKEKWIKFNMTQSFISERLAIKHGIILSDVFEPEEEQEQNNG